MGLCPQIDVASQGESVEEAKQNLREAVQMFFECEDEEWDGECGKHSCKHPGKGAYL